MNLALLLTGLLTLPQISITTDQPIVNKDDNVVGAFTLSGQPTWPMHMKGHGNSTWNFPKKPYKVKFDSKQAVLGMPADKEWILLANYSDKTLMRNSLAMSLSRKLKMDYTPRSQFVDVVVNGTDQGDYLFIEEVKIAPDRVDVGDDGFLLELDQHQDATNRFKTSRAVPYSIVGPSDPSIDQKAYIQGYVQGAEDVLNGPDFADPLKGYAQYIDVDSFVEWYLVNEVFKNVDAANTSSIYLSKTSGGKLKMGPVWDFDIGAGNVDYSGCDNPTGWWVRLGSPWFTRLFQDPAFDARVRARWQDLKAHGLNDWLAEIDTTALALDVSEQRNFKVWNILNTWVWPNRVVTGSYAGEVAAMKKWLGDRVAWMDAQWSSPPANAPK